MHPHIQSLWGLIKLVVSVLISAVDTWLHFTTTTVPFTQISTIDEPTGYSFGLIYECLKGNNSAAANMVT